jgi:hypothetical protein
MEHLLVSDPNQSPETQRNSNYHVSKAGTQLSFFGNRILVGLWRSDDLVE